MFDVLNSMVLVQLRLRAKISDQKASKVRTPCLKGENDRYDVNRESRQAMALASLRYVSNVD